MEVTRTVLSFCNANYHKSSEDMVRSSVFVCCLLTCATLQEVEEVHC